ncbi:baseplate J/gp47 family protein [Novosphingobium olei]|uniref:Baseplate protein J-like barrel domain-containing protein n=1 Tax=Novosphingobium olei TaxID=2728851 RepID=A0A7Y0BNS9_9SPHN|nr:baseplate J/gp47 family protein [Novosphingobium olei]NML93812.1 hypothetical protein [Novosphingobium olei]
MSNVPSPAFTTAGLTVPTESAIKEGLWADFQAAFGGNLNESDATPQGQLVTSLTAVIGAANDLLLSYVNLVDPARTSGRMQDAIGRIYYMERIAGQPTVVTCTCTGRAGTVIPDAALAQATDGRLYQSLGAVTIPSGGTVSIDFASVDVGPIECAPGTLTRIYRVVPGWDAITNPSAGVPGRNIETATEFEARRAGSVAANAAGSLPAVKGAVLAVDGVSDAYVTENATGSAVTIGGVSIAARSIYVCVSGGTDADVAKAIWSKKPPGCAMTGSTSVTVTDTSEGYSPPYPSYTVKLQRPTPKPIYFAVALADNGQVPADAEAQIRAAIAAAFAGQDGGPRARIGGKVYALRFVSAVAGLGTWAQVVSLQIGTTSSPTSSEVDAGIGEIPTLAQANISVTLV